MHHGKTLFLHIASQRIALREDMFQRAIAREQFVGAFAAQSDAVAVQLAAYRLAWSALADVPLDKVRAAFYYVRHDRTVRPADLLDEDGLKALIARIPVTN